MLFTAEEYEERDLSFHEAFARLPVVIEIDGLGVRWVGPLVDLALDRALGDMAQAAWGHLECCGWQRELEDVSFEPEGIPPGAAEAFGRAARALASEGEYAGPESDPEVWASWLAFERAGLHALVRARAEQRGWDR